jgi:hypothetical protein
VEFETIIAARPQMPPEVSLILDPKSATLAVRFFSDSKFRA